MRPEALTPALSELRILASKDLDARQLLTVVLAGDARLPERLRTAELLPLGSRIRRRLVLSTPLATSCSPVSSTAWKRPPATSP